MLRPLRPCARRGPDGVVVFLGRVDNVSSGGRYDRLAGAVCLRLCTQHPGLPAATRRAAAAAARA